MSPQKDTFLPEHIKILMHWRRRGWRCSKIGWLFLGLRLLRSIYICVYTPWLIKGHFGSISGLGKKNAHTIQNWFNGVNPKQGHARKKRRETDVRGATSGEGRKEGDRVTRLLRIWPCPFLLVLVVDGFFPFLAGLSFVVPLIGTHVYKQGSQSNQNINKRNHAGVQLDPRESKKKWLSIGMLAWWMDARSSSSAFFFPLLLLNLSLSFCLCCCGCRWFVALFTRHFPCGGKNQQRAPSACVPFSYATIGKAEEFSFVALSIVWCSCRMWLKKI